MRMRKTFLMLITLIMTLQLTTVVHARDAIIHTDHVNIREGPGIDFKKIKQASTGEVYSIIQVEGKWVEIQLDGMSGWVTSEYITISNKDKVANAKSEYVPNVIENQSVTIQIDNTQIRSGPSTDHDIILFANKDTEFAIISEDENWYEIVIQDGSGYLFKKLVDQKQEANVNNLRNKTILIDAGHGGRDVGAISINDIFEKDFTAKTADELTKTLTMLGAEVILTRTEDEYTRLASRPALSNIHDTDAFISIHYNSFPKSRSVTGIDAYYYTDYSERLARLLQDEIIKETNADDRGIAVGDFQVLRQNYNPAVLLELGFISNQQEEQLLLTNAYQKRLVKGITNGLIKYFSD